MGEQPPVTTLTTVDYETEFLAELIPSSWLKPFKKLLLFLQIIDDVYYRGDNNINSQEFCFRHTHDLSKLSDVFLRVNVNEGIRYSIDLLTFRFPGEHQGRIWVVRLVEHANGVLSRFRVSVFTHHAVGTLTQWSDENLGLLQPVDRRRYPP
jgi:hypothetical protein